MIKLNSINKYYNRNTRHENHVINNTSVTLPATGIVCLLGESGSGKTTLLNCIGRLDSFASGNIEIDGKKYSGRINNAAEKLRNSKFAYVFQNYFLIREQTVYENLSLALGSYELSDEEKESRIDYVLEAVDMKRYKKRNVSMLSGGQQQRVAIARALIKSPEVVFADEPTGNLDEANTVRVMNILKKLSKSCLVLLATHEKRIAEFYADRIITISDGKIVDDRGAGAQQELVMLDDHDIYLDEYAGCKLSGNIAGEGRIDVNYYSSDESKIEITLVKENGNLYIVAPKQLRVERIDDNSSIKICEGKRPVYSMEDVGKEEFSLRRLENSKTNKLKLRQLARMAVNGIASMGGKIIVPIIAMVLTAVLCMFAVIDFTTLSSIEYSDFITTDSRLLNVEFERGSFIEASDTKQYVKLAKDEFIDYCNENGIGYMIYPVNTSVTKFSVDGFEQIKEVSAVLSDFSYVPLSLLDTKTIVMGRLPEGTHDVVVDKWVLESFMKQKNPVARAVTDIKDFLGKQLSIGQEMDSFNIVGICDSQQPSIYLNDVTGLGICRSGLDVMTLDSFKKAFPGKYDDIELLDGEALFNSKTGQNPGAKYYSNSGFSLDVIGTFTEEIPAKAIVNNSTVELIRDSQVESGLGFTIYTNDKTAVKNFFTKKLSEDVKKNLQVKISDKYTVNMEAYMEARSVKLNARVLVTVMITIISFAVLYVAMRANAIQKLREVAVYRLLGIKRSNIRTMFAIQSILLSLCTTLIGALATAGVLYMLSGIESLGVNFVVTWPSVIITIALLFIVNILTSLLPIGKLLRIPPAQLASKYDL